MRGKEWLKRYFLTIVLGTALVTSSIPVGATQTGDVQAEISDDVAETASEDDSKENVIEISTPAELVAVAEKCSYDNWSLDKTIRLTADINMADIEFSGIPYFNGVFDGNGYEIRQLRFEPQGSEYGFFRYVGESGVVKDLTLSAVIVPSGSQEYIGGLVGVNYGTIMDCSFEGSVEGLNYVGAVAGSNKATGKIFSCSSSAIVMATNYTGGIVGINEGIISSCSSKSSINIEELETTLDLGGIDIGTLNFTQTVVNRSDMGGIAGFSTGVISDCKNDGTIGYKHTGYNVGGIVGGQSGIVLNCTNEGKVYGRKDVGGIVGQAEPYVESEYLEDKVEQTQADIDRLNNTLNNLSATMSQTSAEVKRQTESLNQQYKDSVQNISNNLGTLSDAAQDHPETQEYVDNINAALDHIEAMQPSEGENLSQEQLDQIQSHLDSITDNLGNLQGSYIPPEESPEDLANRFSEQVKNENQTRDYTEDIKNLAQTVDNGVQSISTGLESAVNQMNQITDNISNDMNTVINEEELIVDISSIETAETLDGVISGCVNRGEIHGDLNVGGIAGTMNIEYDGDPEYEVDTSESLNVRMRSTVNDVIIHCINYGKVMGKMNCVGGIAGLQEIGFIYDSEGYGTVESSTGSYLGGIAGRSAGTVEKSYTLCNLIGTNSVGGICGSGASIKDCISVSTIDSDGEKVGSVAGSLENGGTVKGNYFVGGELHGIDNVSYAGVADRISYEEVMKKEGIPQGFAQVTVVFETEDEILSEKQIAYGGSVSASDLPVVTAKEGYYVEWPDEKALTDIRENLTVTAEYVPWTESVAGSEVDENGRNLLIVVGEFYEDTSIVMEKTEGPEGLNEDGTVVYAYTWALESEHEKEFQKLEAHFRVPETEDEVSVWVQQDETWQEAAVTEDGSYLVAEIPYGAAFAVVTQPADKNIYLIAVGGAAILLLVIFLIRHHNVRKGQRKAVE